MCKYYSSLIRHDCTYAPLCCSVVPIYKMFRSKVHLIFFDIYLIFTIIYNMQQEVGITYETWYILYGTRVFMHISLQFDFFSQIKFGKLFILDT